MKLVRFVVLAVVLSACGMAQPWKHIGSVSGMKPLSSGVELKAAAARVRVVAISPSVIRVSYAPKGDLTSQPSFAVVSDTGLKAPSVRVIDKGKWIEFATTELRVRVYKSPLRIAFLTPSGEVVSQDTPGRSAAWSGSAFRIWKVMPEDEHYFGLGDKAGPLDLRDRAFTMWNTDAFGWQEGTDPLYKSIPFFLGIRQGVAYGIFFDNTFRSSFDFGKELRDQYAFGSEGGQLDYYYFYGPHPKTVVQNYTALTGRTPLPPLFALGYQQSRWSYFPEVRVREIASELRRRKIPADVLYLDIDYQDGNRPFTIDRQRFPTFETMIGDLGAQGFKVVAITDLHIKKETGYKPYDQGLAGDHFVKNPDGSVYVGKVWPGDSVFPDFTRSATRHWWGTLYRDFVDMGISGFWNDMNEPAVFRYPQKTMPLEVVHRVEDRKTDHREVHNVLGMENARATYEGLLRLRPDQRPFVLTRAAYAGAQRYAATWTGDNTSNWSHLKLTVPTLLNLGVSGYPFSGVDIGGFDGSPQADLLTRWMQLGAFNPIFRNHTVSGSLPQEPWVHGPEHEAIRRRYIETRYRLLPYIYTAMEETSRTGIPLMRPMFMEFPSERTVETVDRQFMFGGDLLVAPKLVDTLDPYEVRLPAGLWYDYWNGARIQGGTPIRVQPTLDVLPVYVRAGAIIAHQPVIQHVDEIPKGPLELRIYPGPDCRGSLYADDGKTFAYKRGESFRTGFTCDAKPGALSVTVARAEGKYKPWWTSLRLIVAGISQPRAVSVDGKIMSEWHYDPGTSVATFEVPNRADGFEVLISY